MLAKAAVPLAAGAPRLAAPLTPAQDAPARSLHAGKLGPCHGSLVRVPCSVLNSPCTHTQHRTARLKCCQDKKKCGEVKGGAWKGRADAADGRYIMRPTA